MAYKFLLAVLCCLATLENVNCGGFGGFSGFGGFGANIMLVNQLRWQLVAAQQQAKLEQDTTNTTIQNNIATAQASVTNQVTLSQAQESSSSALCANKHKAALTQVNPGAVKICDQAVQLQAADLQVTALATVHMQIAGVYTQCPFWPPGNQALCIQDFCAGVSTQITTQRDGVLEALAAAKTDSAACVESEVQKVSAAIAAADAALAQCNANVA